ncbi:CsgG/HfaB family protein [bacterium]
MRIALAILSVIIAAAAATAPAAALPAYIDVQSGIVVGRGEARMREGESERVARDTAIKSAKKNIYKILERQPVDPKSMEQRTVGEYLREHPNRQQVLDSFIDSAKVFKEVIDEDGVLHVTILLPVEGPDGYKIMLARLMGRVVPARTPGAAQDAAGIDEDLRAQLAGREAGDVGRPYEIALIDFDNNSKYHMLNLGSIFTDRLIDKFSRDRRFIFIGNADIRDILDDYDLSVQELWDSEVNDVLRIEELDGVIIGSVTRYQPGVEKHGIGGTGYLETSMTVEVDLRVLNTRTGRWTYFDTVSATVSERTFTLKSADDADRFIKLDNLDDEEGLAARAFDSAVTKVEGVVHTVFPLEGYVLKVIGERVYVSLTRSDGLLNGDTLNVYKIGDMLTDPVTGEEIDRIRDRIGSLRVTEANETYSQAVSAEVPIEPINPGDVVTVSYE